MRRTIMRYTCLCQTMVLTMVSPKVKKRFPTLDHLVEAGLLMNNEKAILDNLNSKFPKPSKHWLPVVWAASIVTRARREGRIRDDFAVKTIIDELNKFRGQCGLLISYDTISVPLVYTQVVTLAVYSYFITSAMGRQWTESQNETNVSNIDLYFPIFTTLQFFFYMGWLKVAESLINPFGEDDDDFEVNWMIDRNLQVSYMIVDEMHHEHPELLKDQYWDEVFPAELPYTVATEGQREEYPQPSTAKIEVPVSQQGMVTVTPSSIRINDMANQDQTVSYKFPPTENLGNEDAMSGIHFTADIGRQPSKKFTSDRVKTIGSQGSLQSGMAAGQGSLPRVNSVTSVLKRLFSREDQRPPPTPTNQCQPDGNEKLQFSASSASLTGKAMGGGSLRIANQIIEEVDEQNTITSMATKGVDTRPTAESIFAMGPPPASAPVNVPQTNNHLNAGLEQPSIRRPRQEALSSSAPSQWARFSVHGGSSVTTPTGEYIPMERPGSMSINIRPRLDSDIGATLSAAASQHLGNEDELMSTISNESIDDEFQKLKTEREKQRKERYIQKLVARSISAQQAVGGGEFYTDNEALLVDLNNQSKKRTIEIIRSQEDPSDNVSPEST